MRNINLSSAPDQLRRFRVVIEPRSSKPDSRGFAMSLRPHYFPEEPKTIDGVVFKCRRIFKNPFEAQDFAKKLFGKIRFRNTGERLEAKVDFRSRTV